MIEGMNYFDLGIILLILVLGLKGFVNGFFKELFGLIGIVGGVFVASKYAYSMGVFIDSTLFQINNDSALSLTGFLVTLMLFWMSMGVLGSFFKKLSSSTGLGSIDRLLGIAIGSGKIFLVVSIVIFSITSVKIVNKHTASFFQDSIMYPILRDVGGIIVSIEGLDDVKNSVVNKITDDIGRGVSEVVKQKLQTQSLGIQNGTINQDINQNLKGGLDLGGVGTDAIKSIIGDVNISNINDILNNSPKK